MKIGPFEIFPKQDPPDFQDCYLAIWLFPFTGIHLLIMREKNKGLVRISLLLLWGLFPFLIPTLNLSLINVWFGLCALIFLLWIYDLMTVKSLFYKRWPKSHSTRV